MLSFTIKDHKTIQVDRDNDGLQRLMDALGRVREQGHVHIKSPSAGGNLLSERSPWGENAVAEVIVTLGGS